MEEWRDIVGFEGLYQISNLGRVKSLARYVKHWKGGESFLKEKMRKICKNQEGYLSIMLHNEGVKTTHFVHKLLAEAFVPNPDNLPLVCFRNGNNEDISLENLVWIDSQNLIYHTNFLNRNNMEEFVIEKGIPIPEKELKQKYPYNLMEVGDSFKLVSIDNKDIVRLQTSAVQYRRRFNNDRRFVVRRISENEIRIWRVK